MKDSREMIIEQMEIYFIRAKWSHKRHSEIYEKVSVEAKNRANIRFLVSMLLCSCFPIIYFVNNFVVRIAMLVVFILSVVFLQRYSNKELVMKCNMLKDCAERFLDLEKEIKEFKHELSERDGYTVVDISKRDKIFYKYSCISDESPIVLKKEAKEEIEKLQENGRKVLSTTHDLSAIGIQEI